MTDQEIKQGLEILKIKKDNKSPKTISKGKDIFTSYRTFSAYESRPTIYSSGTARSCVDSKLDGHSTEGTI